MSTSELKAPVIGELKRLLTPLGYRKNGSLFSRQLADVVHLIGLQSSQGTTASKVVLTVNLAIFVPSLVDPDMRQHAKPSIWEAHWRERLGFAMPETRDKWWSITSPAEANAVAQEIASHLGSVGLTALAELSNVDALSRLWESGRCPGLT